MRLKLLDDGYNLQKVKNSIRDVIRSNYLLSMSTSDKEEPHINTAFYAFDDGLNLYILTPPKTKHGKNLEENSSVAVDIHDSHQKFNDDKQGLQIFGTAEIVAEEDKIAEILELYTERFPAAEKFASSPEDIGELDSSFYRIKPERIKLFDEPNFGTETWIDVEIKN